jgi:hypothetical protein
MNELLLILIGVAIGIIGTLGIICFYRWLDLLRREVARLEDKQRYLIRDNQLITEFLFWKNEQKK